MAGANRTRQLELRLLVLGAAICCLFFAFLGAPTAARAAPASPDSDGVSLVCEQVVGNASPCTLTISPSPGIGRVVSNPGGISCPADCEEAYERICEFHCSHNHITGIGQDVTLTAQEGYLWRWTGDCRRRAGDAPNQCTVRVNPHKTVGVELRDSPDLQAPTRPSINVTPGAYSATVSWSGANDYWIGGYDVFANGKLAQRVSGSTLSTRLEGLSCQTAYTIRVEAFDANDNRAGSETRTTTRSCSSGGSGDRRPPNTQLHTHPPRVTTARRASFHFGANEARVTFACKLDRGLWFRCRAPKVYRNLKKGTHTFSVRARDAAGNVDRTPAVWRWRIR